MAKETFLDQAKDLEILLESLEENVGRWGVRSLDFHFYDDEH